MNYILIGSTMLLFGLWIALEWRADKKMLRFLRWLIDGFPPPVLHPHWDKEELTVVCMDCGKHIGGPKVNLADAIQARSVSHGLCPDCLRKRLAELEN